MHTRYHPQQSCGKVMFLQLSVILFTGGGVCHPLCSHLPPPCAVPAGIRSISGRYASYWNAFLYCKNTFKYRPNPRLVGVQVGKIDGIWLKKIWREWEKSHAKYPAITVESPYSIFHCFCILASSTWDRKKCIVSKSFRWNGQDVWHAKKIISNWTRWLAFPQIADSIHNSIHSSWVLQRSF